MVGIGHFNCKGDWAYAQFFFIKNVETAEFFSATPTFIIEPLFSVRFPLDMKIGAAVP